jgi:hypothetical protein
MTRLEATLSHCLTLSRLGAELFAEDSIDTIVVPDIQESLGAARHIFQDISYLCSSALASDPKEDADVDTMTRVAEANERLMSGEDRYQ